VPFSSVDMDLYQRAAMGQYMALSYAVTLVKFDNCSNLTTGCVLWDDGAAPSPSKLLLLPTQPPSNSRHLLSQGVPNPTPVPGRLRSKAAGWEGRGGGMMAGSDWRVSDLMRHAAARLNSTHV
jgi:hypothetical protein